MDAEVRKLKEQEFKDELTSKFIPTSTYSGKQVAHILNTISVKTLDVLNKPTEIKKGDVISVRTASKVRPAVVTKILKDRTVLYIHLTSTENIHCMTYAKSRFFGEGCFTYGFSICTEQYAIENYLGTYDNMKAVNQAIRDLRTFFINKF